MPHHLRGRLGKGAGSSGGWKSQRDDNRQRFFQWKKESASLNGGDGRTDFRMNPFRDHLSALFIEMNLDVCVAL
jgi:hypothetical protein